MNFKSVPNIIIEFIFCITLSIFIVGIFTHAVQAALVDIVEGDEWYYFKGTKNPPFKWNHIGFNEFDENWFKGRTGIGYGHNEVRTILNDMRSNYQSVYIRREFILNESLYLLQKNNSTRTILTMVCDGSFKVWLNGIEVIRSHENRVTPRIGHRPRALVLDITAFAHELLPGRNVVASQCSNDDIDSGSFLFMPTFLIE